MIRFEWDENKNSTNLKKHGVDFKEAATVFLDEDALIIADGEHSEYEERFVIMGMSSKGRLLVVCHCYRNINERIRLISARKATRNESFQYVEVNEL